MTTDSLTGAAGPMRSDTIAAVATPPGVGGVAIVRVSGPESLSILRGLFRPMRGAPGTVRLFPQYTLRHGFLTDGAGRDLDEVLAVYMPGPNSYTGEDVVEIHCHGGCAVPAETLRAVLSAGARLAGPGEFSKRAFLNGRMDLTRAEAVAEAVAAPTRKALELATPKLKGLLAARIGQLRRLLEELRAQLCLAVDFPEEEIECLTPGDFAEAVGRVRAELQELAANYERGRPFREGAAVVLAGRVNAGKSSLLNAFLGRQRAIVTDIPGTTRDFIEECVTLAGLPVRLVDTAGLRETLDEVEAVGVRASRSLAGQADLLLLVVDGAAPPNKADLEFALSHASIQPGQDKRDGSLLVVLNKSDLIRTGESPEDRFVEAGLPVLRVSARTGDGLGDLAAMARRMLLRQGAEPGADDLVPNLRQSEAIRKAESELADLLADLTAGIPYDLLGVRLETACVLLAEVTGEIASEDVLRSIFDSFCIGK